ncbi:Uncharacterized protein Adt_26049 [Abeliophyllum distichum]|uniref:Uncharacterized protein n=1 Tax=Abeliophyllum distichum TaxID=126358 RepID=A0ABD1RQ78_9LAMI
MNNTASHVSFRIGGVRVEISKCKEGTMDISTELFMLQVPLHTFKTSVGLNAEDPLIGMKVEREFFLPCLALENVVGNTPDIPNLAHGSSQIGKLSSVCQQ